MEKQFRNGLKLKNALTILVFVILLFSCGDQENPNSPIEVKFQLTNPDGKSTTLFQETEEIFFEFEIINNSKKDISLVNIYPNDSCLIRVYQKLESDKAYIGSPLKAIVQTVFIDGYPIPTNETFYVKLPWTGSPTWVSVPNGWRLDQKENNSLSKGDYFAELVFIPNFSEFSLEEIFSKIDFEVK